MNRFFFLLTLIIFCIYAYYGIGDFNIPIIIIFAIFVLFLAPTGLASKIIEGMTGGGSGARIFGIPI